MNKSLLLLFLLTIHLFASDKTVLIKAKAKQVNNIVKAMISIRGVVAPGLARLRTGDEKNAYFIKHVHASIGEDVVYDISLTHTFRQEHVLGLKFDFIYEGRGDTLNFTVTDNKGKETNLSVKIKNSLGKNGALIPKRTTLKSINFWKEKPNLWRLTNTDEAIKELYGPNKTKTNVIDISVTKQSPFYYFVPISISSKVQMKSIAIFSDDLTEYPYRRKERKKFPSVRAIISTPKNTIINYSSFYILTMGSCCVHDTVPITVAGIDEDGQVYKTILNTKLICSADCEM